MLCAIQGLANGLNEKKKEEEIKEYVQQIKKHYISSKNIKFLSKFLQNGNEFFGQLTSI